MANEHTNEHINLFLVKIELWQIADSPPAPKFTVISKPNEWKRSVQTSSQEGDLTDTKIKQLEFWQQSIEYATANKSVIKYRSPRPQHWFNVSIGRSDSQIALTVDTRENDVRCELYIPDSKDRYQALLANKDKIENELGISKELEWQELPGKKASRIRVTNGFNFSDATTWESAFAWLIDMTARFKKVFSKD
jgi:hypothetical protein